MEIRPFRVLFVLNASGGGASQGIYELLDSVSKEQVEAYVVVPDSPNANQVERLDQLCRLWMRVPSIWWNKKSHNSWKEKLIYLLKSNIRTFFGLIPTYRIWRLIKKHNIDIVYTGTSLNREGAIAARHRGIPHIWHIKETIGPRGRVQFPKGELKLSQYILKHSQRVVVMTEYIKSFFHAKCQDNPKLQVVYDGIDASKFQDPGCGQTLRSTLGLRDSDILVAMVASLSSSWKKHHLFVEMARVLKDQSCNLKYVLFGPLPKKHQSRIYNRPWEYYQTLMDLLKGHPVSEDFIWAGFHENIPELMDAIDILVHPCDIEPFGRLAIEAQAAGTVVVGPDKGGISESVVPGKTGFLVKADDVSAFAQAVKELSQNSSLRQQLGYQGQQHVRNTFKQSQHNSLILDIFNDITESLAK